MPKQNHEPSESRRRFLRTSLVTGVGVAAAAVTAGEAVANTADPATPDTKADDKGYRLTQHVADYYRTAAL